LENYVLPNYDVGIFRVVPTIIQESLKEDINAPYEEWVFADKNIRKRFSEADLSIVLIIDSLCLERLNGLVRDLWEENGKIILSSVIPSTTANAVGSIYIGMPPEQSGLIAMRFYVKEIGNFVDALLGKVSGVGSKDALASVGVKLSSFLWDKPILSTLGSENLLFVDLLPNNIQGGLERFYEENLISLHYSNGLDSVFEIRDIAREMMKKKFRGIIFVYFSDLDTASHKYSYKSWEWKEQLSYINLVIKKLIEILRQLKKETGKNLQLIIMSDHGHEAIEMKINISEEIWTDFFKKQGIEAYMSSGRFAFMYLKQRHKIEDIDIEKIEAFFDHKVDAITIDHAIKTGFWPSLKEDHYDRFLVRAGDIIIIPHDYTDIYLDKRRDEKIIQLEDVGNEYKKLRANHGGLTEREMLTPFIALVI